MGRCGGGAYFVAVLSDACGRECLADGCWVHDGRDLARAINTTITTRI